MQMQGRAFYNLLRISYLEDPTVQVIPWQVEDYRSLKLETLFSSLKKLGAVLDEASFLAYAENADSPEDLAECICVDEEDMDRFDQIYLLLFELWRRLLPQKQTLSTFCDELDQLIELYDQGKLEEEERLQKALIDLESILEETADLGKEPVAVFEGLCLFCAHDVGGFLYDYIFDLVESSEELAASELLDAFYPFMPDKKWFNLLRAWMVASQDIEELNRVVERLLEELQETPDLDLLLEMSKFLVHRGDVRLFMQTVKQALELLQTEEHFQQLLHLVAEYYRCLDKDEKAQEIADLIKARSHLDLEQPFNRSDKMCSYIFNP